MYHDTDFISAETKQPVRFDHFEPFVHQRGRVNRDLRAHVPRRVLQRFGHRGGLNRRFFASAKGPARGRQNYSPHF